MCSRSLLLLLFLLPGMALASSSAPAAGSRRAGTDTTEAPSTGPRAKIRFYPGSVWSSSAGIGIGVGVQVRDLFAPGTGLRLKAAPAWNRGTYSAAFYTADPGAGRRYALARLLYETTGVQRYYGIGPASARAALVNVEKDQIEAELRLGVPLFRRLLLQPNLRYTLHVTEDFDDHYEGAYDALTPASRRNLLFSLGRLPGTEGENRQAGLSAGIETALDLRRPEVPGGIPGAVQAGTGLLLQGTARRYEGIGGPDLRFDRFSLAAYYFLPLPGADRLLGLRALAVVTENRGDTILPFYLLPSLGSRLTPGYKHYRFFGNDLLVLGAEVRQRLFSAFGVGMEGTFGFNAASVYDDLFDQFEPRLTLRTVLPEGRDRYPLRPSGSVGLRIVPLNRAGVHFGATIGFSAEGFGLFSFHFVNDLTALHPRVRW